MTNCCTCVGYEDFAKPSFWCTAVLRSKTEQEAVKKCNNYGIFPASPKVDPNITPMFMCKYFKPDGIGAAAGWRCHYVENDEASHSLCMCRNANEDSLIAAKMETL